MSQPESSNQPLVRGGSSLPARAALIRRGIELADALRSAEGRPCLEEAPPDEHVFSEELALIARQQRQAVDEIYGAELVKAHENEIVAAMRADTDRALRTGTPMTPFEQLVAQVLGPVERIVEVVRVVTVPDFGGLSVDCLRVLVKPGETLVKDESPTFETEFEYQEKRIQFQIASAVGGRVQEVLFKDGDQVNVGEPILTVVQTRIMPCRFADYISQDIIRDRLRLAIAAARQRGEVLDHVLLYGPPDLGKMTLAFVIASELGEQMRSTSGLAIRTPGDLAAILTNLQAREVLFIDEVDRLSSDNEEILSHALANFELDIVIGDGPSARSVLVPLHPFTLIATTTDEELLPSALGSRFSIVHRLEPYTPSEIEKIARRVHAHPVGAD